MSDQSFAQTVDLVDWNVQFTAKTGTFVLDILQAEMLLEERLLEAKNENQPFSDVLLYFASYVKGEFKIELTPSETWDFVQRIRSIFDKLKKSYDGELMLLLATESTPSESQTEKPTSSTPTSPESKQQDCCTNDNPKPTLPQNKQET